MSTAVQTDSHARRESRPATAARIAAEGKFLRAGEERFLVKGVTYGTFAPDADGYQFPSIEQIAADFRQMADFGINTVRTYTAPRRDLLDAAARRLGIFYPPSLLLMFVTGLVFVALLWFSVILSRQRRQIDRLMEESAVLAAEIRELREERGGASAPQEHVR